MSFEEFTLDRVTDVEREVLEHFSCGDAELDQFLQEFAQEYDKHGLTATTVAFRDGDDVPVAYFSLSADSLQLQGVELTELGLPFEAPLLFYPAIKITKLATREDLQSEGIGAELIKLIAGIVFASPFSVRLLTVNAVNRERTLAFYERAGFVASHKNGEVRKKRNRVQDQDRNTILMYKDIYAEPYP